MISIVITSFKEPKTIGKAIESIISQDIKEDYELIIVAPDKETLNVASDYAKKSKQIKLFQDPGLGKSHALNLLLPILKGRIIILTDGDIYVGDNAINLILDKFSDESVGCVSGNVKSQNQKDNLFGYWSNLLCFAANKLRQTRNNKSQFLECSGYLWAFRNKVIKKFPKDVAEDMIVPILFSRKGWKIKYADKAEVYVKFPCNLKDFIEQKQRTAKSHEHLAKYINPGKIPRMKTFFNEVSGSFLVLSYASSFKELVYTFSLFPIRLYVWLAAFFHEYIKKEHYQDGWKRVKSAR